MQQKTKIRILVVVMCLSSLLSFLILPLPSSYSTKTLGLWLANAIGYTGIVMLLWMYILGAKSVMSTIFKDLAPILKIHKWLGKYGSIAILLHPLLITFSYGESLLYSALPNIGSEFERHVTLGRISIWILILIWLTSAILRDRIKFRPWKYLHYLAYICLPFALLHVPDVGSNYMAGGVVRIYYFLLVMAFLIFFILRLRGFLNLDKTKYRVLSHTKLTGTDYVLKLKPIGEIAIKPRSGQYIYLKPGFISEDHPFSVLQYDEKDRTISICYRVFGNFTKFLSTTKIGSTLYLGGPYGSFMADYNSNNRPTVFISGGIGITPFADQIINDAGRCEQWLFAANRDHASAVLLSTMKKVLGNQLVPIFSQENPDKIKIDEETGRIDAAMINKYLSNPNKYNFYMCGPPAMMKSVYSILRNIGVSKDQIRSEKFEW